ncbi:Glycylpeptide N-tetradecanoyltransferase 1 [Diplonema papillatum]|nr:Glycylpeptide N-tetradecanoyltransferase 1 [Diplonema papillatum]
MAETAASQPAPAQVEEQTDAVNPTAEGAEGDAKNEAGGADGKQETEEERAARTAKNKAKKERQKAKKKAESAAAGSLPASSNLSKEDEEARWKLMQEQLQAVIMPPRAQSTSNSHAFWDTQPVMQLDRPFEIGDQEGPLESRRVDEVQAEPYDLPDDDMEWWNPDVTNPEHMELIYELLRDHYVEDDDAMFRFNYTHEFLRWALLPPNHIKNWHVAIRSKKDASQVVGFISGIPVKIAARNNLVDMCEINFLCVNKHCRERRLAPMLIKEVTRRVNRENIWQAIYTAGILITSTIAQCQYWHRSLNPEKLISIGFSRIPQTFSKFSKPMVQVKKHYQLPEKPRIPGIRRMVKKDKGAVRALLEVYLSKFGVHQVYTNDQIVHWLLPRPDVVDTYVVEAKDGKITDVCSFYTLQSTIIGAKKYKLLKAAYCYYNVANTVSLKELLDDAMILAKQQDLDVFNALDIMDNKDVFKDLKFGMGDGHLRYYFYNWRFPELKPSNVGMVLL